MTLIEAVFYPITYTFRTNDNVILTSFQKRQIAQILPQTVSPYKLVRFDFMHEFTTVYSRRIHETLPDWSHNYTMPTCYMIGEHYLKDEYGDVVRTPVSISAHDDLEPESVDDVIEGRLLGHNLTFKEWAQKCKFIDNQFVLVAEIEVHINPDIDLSQIQLESNLCCIL